MVDFTKYTDRVTNADPRDLLALYESLDLQTSHIDPRPLQREAFQQLGARLDSNDVALKLSTGSGKTAIGLIYLFAQMLIREEPVVYLVPTVQLAEQVIAEAQKLGIAAHYYPAGNPHPDSSCVGAKAVLVCTYDKLFNAKSTFDRPDVMLRPTAMVLDDVHSGMEKIRDSFTLRTDNKTLRAVLIEMLGSAMSTYSDAQWQAVVRQRPTEQIEIPYWIVHSLRGELLKVLSEHESDSDFMFSWPYLRESLTLSRWILDAQHLEISPDILPIERVPAYAECAHRLFLSATLADDSLLVRELGCNAKEAQLPLLLGADKGSGERMIVAPTLIDPTLNREHLLKWAGQIAKRHNVVVLTNRWSNTDEWENVGAHLARQDVAEVVMQLRSAAKTQLVVFAQRYDGVDLPDNACRILIMDGMPFGEGLAEQIDFGKMNVPNNFTNRLIYRIEQGMGRGVRSHADYCVVILVGPELANFISRKDVRNQMNAATKLQLELALDLATMAKNEGRPPANALQELVNQCLQRDKNWKSFYDNKVRKPLKGNLDAKVPVERIEFAKAERKAFAEAVGNDFPAAVKTLRTALNNAGFSEKETGWQLQKIARYLIHYSGAEAIEVQRAAHTKNSATFRPTGGKFRPKPLGSFGNEAQFISWYEQFENINGSVACLQELIPRLSFSVSTNLFEESVRQLGEILNAQSSRPESDFGEGPDNLWLWEEISIIIECKSENRERLHKKDSGQLHNSVAWFERNYPHRPAPVPLIISDATKPDRDAHFPTETRVMSSDNLRELLEKIQSFLVDIGHMAPLSMQPELIRTKRTERKIDTGNLMSAYTKRLRK